MGWCGPMTHRQFEVWQEWLNQQWNKPSRTDHYLLRIASYIAEKDLEPIVFVTEPVKDSPYGPRRLKTKEDVRRAQEKVNKALLMRNLGLTKPN